MMMNLRWLVLLAAAAAPLGAQMQSSTGSVRVGGRTRTFLVDVPPQYDPKAAVPLVLVFHGGGGNAQSARTQTHMSDLAMQNGFIAAYPNGTGAFANRLLTWNTGSCCGYAKRNSVADVAFVRAVIDSLQHTYRIDTNRVYATGLSNGGMMSHMMACALSDRFAAVAPVSGELSMSCAPAQPVSVLLIHGTADQNLPYEGGVGPKALDPHQVKPVQYAVDSWLQLNHCPARPAVDSAGVIVHRTYAPCGNNSAVELYTIVGGAHAWPKGERLSRVLDAPSNALDATAVIWEFFTRHHR